MDGTPNICSHFDDPLTSVAVIHHLFVFLENPFLVELVFKGYQSLVRIVGSQKYLLSDD